MIKRFSLLLRHPLMNVIKKYKSSGRNTIDYFSTFNFPKSFFINQNLLNEKFKELQKQNHPDKHSKLPEV
jgi:hypothetical protein